MVYMVKNDFALQNYNKKMTYAREKEKTAAKNAAEVPIKASITNRKMNKTLPYSLTRAPWAL